MKPDPPAFISSGIPRKAISNRTLEISFFFCFHRSSRQGDACSAFAASPLKIHNIKKLAFALGQLRFFEKLAHNMKQFL
jgi:hypothetical protein